MWKRITLSLFIFASVASLSFGQNRKTDEGEEFFKFQKTVQKTVNMVGNSQVRQMVQKRGLNIMNVTWEDTGRYKGSSVGPNISDVTLQVQLMDPRNEKFTLHCLPVIRYPNFSDKTADLPPGKFYLLVGNEKGKGLKKITLSEYLDNFRKYLNKPGSWKGDKNSLLAPRDTHVLVSAQACFLPIPKGKKVEFNPVIFNYQSFAKNPAVLCILATREGTSATIIDNQRDRFAAGPTWGQRLFFNKNGQRAVLAGQRMSDFQKDRKNRKSTGTTEPSLEANKEAGLNMVLMIQVPLKQKIRRRKQVVYESEGNAAPMESAKSAKSDVEAAVISHGRVEGPFTEIDGLSIERDERFPVRVTVQFYKATSNGVVSDEDIAQVRSEIDRVYKNADYVGSLVTEGDTGRPTEHDGEKFEPPHWWSGFWSHYENNLAMKRDDALKLLRKRFGRDWKRMTKSEGKLARAILISCEEEKATFDRNKMNNFVARYAPPTPTRSEREFEREMVNRSKLTGIWALLYNLVIVGIFIFTLFVMFWGAKSIFFHPEAGSKEGEPKEKEGEK